LTLGTLPTGRLRDRHLAEAGTVPATATVGQAVAEAAGRWLVVLGPDGGPMGAVHPDRLAGLSPGTTLEAALRTCPPSLTAWADTAVRALVHSWAFDQVEPDSAVIALDPSGVVGVWAGDDLRQAAALGLSRMGWDAALPGQITIPELLHTCGYTEAASRCPATLSFPEYPDDPPACPNPGGLAPHRFTW
jgi:hypothetical protein